MLIHNLQGHQSQVNHSDFKVLNFHHNCSSNNHLDNLNLLLHKTFSHIIFNQISSHNIFSQIFSLKTCSHNYNQILPICHHQELQPFNFSHLNNHNNSHHNNNHHHNNCHHNLIFKPNNQ